MSLNLPNVTTREELAFLLEIPLQKLTFILYKLKVDNCYRTFNIPKRSGGFRTISAPLPGLKSIQFSLFKKLLICKDDIDSSLHRTPNISHGFEKGRSIFTNAKNHRNKRIVLNIDLENFFPSIHFGRVKGFFEKNFYFKLPPNIATIIAQIACYKGSLPQGAPTSPIIANFICASLDYRIANLSKKFHLNYSRYADDLTFSTNEKEFISSLPLFLNKLEKEINRAGFSINSNKTRFSIKTSRQSVQVSL